MLKVAWIGSKKEVTWEPASSVPQELVKEFEEGITSSMETLSSEKKYGVIAYTTVNTPTVTAEVPPKKRQKLVDVPSISEGYSYTYNHVLCALIKIC